jgi:DNA-binding CsgD family transcriptional regulator
MGAGDAGELVARGYEAAAAGDWPAARDAFAAALGLGDGPEAMFGLAMSLWWLGDMPGAVTTYERTYALFQRGPDPTLAAASALRLSVHYKQHLANRPAATGWLARAARLIEDAQLEHLRGFLLVIRAHDTDDPVAGESWARRALELAKESGDPDVELLALSQVGAHLVKQGRVAEGMAVLDEAMAGALGGQGDQLDTVVFTTCTTMVSCSSCANFERAAEWVRATDRFQERFGCPFLFIECRLVYGGVLLATGEWEAAERELGQVIERSRDVALSYLVQATAALAELRLAQGRLEDAERLVAGFEGRDEVVLVAARIELTRGRPAVAAAMVRPRLEVLGSRQLASAPLLELLGDAEIAMGTQDSAAERGRALAELGAGLDCRVLIARGERLLGRSLAAADPASARRHLETAVSELTGLGIPFEAARTRRLLAETVRGADRAAAEAEARTALIIFERLGAVAEADITAGLLRELGVQVARVGPKRFGMLTKREQQVLALVAEGLSNPAIAERLFVSRKTAEHHVASILAKLGVATRAEAAAASARQQRQERPAQ